MTVTLDALAAELDGAEYDPEVRLNKSVPSYTGLLKEIRLHGKHRYWQFTPSYVEDFEAGLAAWVFNSRLRQRDQKALLRLVPEIQYFDRDDFIALYRSAFLEQITRWLIDQEKIDFLGDAAAIDTAVRTALKTTWFCPITDSLDIGQFHHVNRIDAKSFRPQWRTLRSFGSEKRILKFLEKAHLTRLVLLEDFVGSGSQVSAVLRFATDLLPHMDLLFVPLVICERGLEQLVRKHPEFDIRPALVIPRQVHVERTPNAHEPTFVSGLRDAIQHTHTAIGEPAFGFRDTGVLAVMYTNCPDNAPAILWKKTSNWRPLFPRASRETDPHE